MALPISAANDAGHRFGHGVGGGLDEFRPAVDPVMHFVQVAVPASGLHGDHGLEIPIVLAGQPDSLPVGDGPENGRIDRPAKMGVQFGPWSLRRLRHTRFYFSWRRRRPGKSGSRNRAACLGTIIHGCRDWLFRDPRLRTGAEVSWLRA